MTYRILALSQNISSCRQATSLPFIQIQALKVQSTLRFDLTIPNNFSRPLFSLCQRHNIYPEGHTVEITQSVIISSCRQATYCHVERSRNISKEILRFRIRYTQNDKNDFCILKSSRQRHIEITRSIIISSAKHISKLHEV